MDLNIIILSFSANNSDQCRISNFALKINNQNFLEKQRKERFFEEKSACLANTCTFGLQMGYSISVFNDIYLPDNTCFSRENCVLRLEPKQIKGLSSSR